MTKKKTKKKRSNKRITKKQINNTVLGNATAADLLKKAKQVEREIKKKTKKFDKSIVNIKRTLDMFDLVEQRLDILKDKTFATIHAICDEADSIDKKKLPLKLKKELEIVREVLKKREPKK